MVRVSKHRRPVQARSRVPLVTAGTALAALWFPLATSPVVGAPATKQAAGPAFTPRTSDLRRATRAAYRTPASPWERAVKAALAQVGKPYVWGAKGPDTFDCSGLVQWAWRQAGVTLAPGTYGQIAEGRVVDSPQPGDLVFPRRSFGPQGPGHVVLAISATQAVEAPGRGMTVRVIPLPAGVVKRVA